MRGGGKADGTSAPRLRGPALVLAAVVTLSYCPPAAAAGPEAPKLVVVLYPDESDGAPGLIQVNRALHSTFGSQLPGRIEIRNEYVNTSRFRDAEFMHIQVSLLQRKYAGRKVDLVMTGLSSALDFALKYRDELFPRVPIVYVAVDEREVKARRLPPDVTGVPIRMDLAATLDLALRLHPDTRRVYVVAGAAPFDTEWEAELRRTFRPHEDRLEFVYLTGLPMDDLLGKVASLPEKSIIYYLHIQKDGSGEPFFPAAALERLAAKANAPIYGHVDTYVGRGAVGGCVFTFEAEGTSAARLGLRILAGEKPETIPVEASENMYLFDSRQLRRWGIGEEDLPPGSIVRHEEETVWDVYKWHIIGVVSLFVVETLLIAGLLIQRARRRQAEDALRAGRRELQLLTGRLLEAQEAERRRIARELHDDLNQGLALLALELDLLAQNPPTSGAKVADRLRELSDRVKELSSAVHDLSHQLHPSKLEQLGLVAALGGLCRELTQCHGLDVTFTHRPGPGGAIPPDAALCLYRVAQEALRNVVKHSGSQYASVELSGTADTIRLRVADDGAGFEPGAAAGNGGLGLVSMRERLALIGGQISIDSRPAGGTRIDVRVPVSAPDRPEDGALEPQLVG